MEDFEAFGALRDPLRRRLYEYVAAQDHPVSRNEAAEAAGVARTLAAFHLDRLAEAGLLETESRRLTGRSGPGAGRPAKLYRRAAGERALSLPPRDYRTAAEVLAETAEAAGLDEELRAAARRRGRALHGAKPVGGLEEVGAVLARRGYEPRREEGGAVRMRNCPFHALAEQFPPLVCGMNLALLQGLLEGAEGLRARMDARPGWCCVVVEETSSKNNED
ncbi:ArsR family transcriptional regulator [Actinomadura sp. NBRC 104425]|uniref:helix-turn-helix transcriptional regulator n=1 Tax=Actinomadura sp. NBRC 104425 TaxID=3032204 RepID=UPI0024A5DF73|nr:helix-turn-helix domain-containing protein [Actinomadura sp. NBRC 104425]GLZ16355.1 ArsR family transcriptional regulator [Actinomadura sp. NBRC 104425]